MILTGNVLSEVHRVALFAKASTFQTDIQAFFLALLVFRMPPQIDM